MSDIVAVLVVPAEGDPGGLLREGRCGIIPAIAELRPTYVDHQLIGPEEWTITSVRWQAGAALPLWWDGRLLEEGWDRAQRAANEHDTLDEDLFRVVPDLDEVTAFAGGLAEAGLASRVV